MWKAGDPEMATPKRMRTHRPKHGDTSLSREWRINIAKKYKKVSQEVLSYTGCGKSNAISAFLKSELFIYKQTIFKLENLDTKTVYF